MDVAPLAMQKPHDGKLVCSSSRYATSLRPILGRNNFQVKTVASQRHSIIRVNALTHTAAASDAPPTYAQPPMLMPTLAWRSMTDASMHVCAHFEQLSSLIGTMLRMHLPTFARALNPPILQGRQVGLMHGQSLTWTHGIGHVMQRTCSGPA